MVASTTVKLNTGAEMPTVGLGTWKSQPGAVEAAVEFALKNGYTLIDTATAYSNEKEVGDGIKASGVPRESFFLTTKLDNPDQKYAEKSLLASLEKLQTPYLDLWLMHWPAPMTPEMKPDYSRDWLDTWKDMVALYKAHPDKLKAIGVSNFSIRNLERLLKESDVVPAVNQIELHPSCPQQELVDFCTSKGIVVTAYSPLGSDGSPLLKHELVNSIAEKHGVSPANVLISLQANRPNITVLTKSVSEQRILQNRKIIDLSDDEIAQLQAIDKTHHFRCCHPSWTGYEDNLLFEDCPPGTKGF